MNINVKTDLTSQLTLGIIRFCAENFTLGVIQSWDKYSQYRLFTFNKDRKLELSENTLVAFVKSSQNKFVNHVIPIDNFIRTSNFKGFDKRYNGHLYSDEVWENIISCNPIISLSEYLIMICIPVYNKDDNSISIIENSLSGIDKYIFNLHEQLIKIPNINLDYEDLAKFISEKTKYINKLNIKKIVSKYTVIQITTFLQRPGKDDQYYVDKSYNLPHKDPYLSYLLPTKVENVFADDNCSSSTYEDKDSKILLVDETKRLQEQALTRYSKKDHIAFLINKYYNDFYANKIRKINLQNQILGIMGMGMSLEDTDFDWIFDDAYLIEQLNKNIHY